MPQGKSEDLGFVPLTSQRDDLGFIPLSKPPLPGRYQAYSELGQGVLKGLKSTAHGVSNLARRAVGAEPIPPPPGLEPTTTLEKVGKYGEQIGEFFLPGGAIGKGAKVIESLATAPKIAKVVGIVGRGALEAGSAAGVTAAQTGGDTGAMAKAAAIAGPLGAAGKAIEGLAPVAAASAARKYEQALGPTKEGMKHLAEKVGPELAKSRTWAFTRTGLLEKAGEKAREAAVKLEDAYDTLPPDAKVKVLPILDDLENAKQAYVVKGTGKIGNPTAFNQVNRVQEMVVDALGPVMHEAPLTTVRSLRQIFDSAVKEAGGFVGKDLKDISFVRAQELAANSMRRHMASDYPDIAALNKEFHIWRSVQEILEETLHRTRLQGSSLSERLATLGGLVVGGQGGVGKAVAGALIGKTVTKTLTSPGWKMVGASNRARLADLLASGEIGEANAFAGRLLASTVAPTTPQPSPPPPAGPPR